MKTKICILIISAFLLSSVAKSQTKDETLLTIDNKSITKSEFERIYKKNNAKDNTIDNKSIEEYLELFINFKLKVIEAEKLGLDTTEAFKKELTGYRKQLAKPYMSDKDIDELLLKEGYQRMGEDINASHILIKVEADASPKDTLTAYNKAIKVRARIMSGEDFAKVAKETSEDPSAATNGGNLGFFTAFQMVYSFESAAFNSKVGDITMPIRTKFGYHIIKVNEKRKAQGEVKVAHIMIATPKGTPEEDMKKAKEKASQVYEKAKAGQNFGDLAKEYSDDKGSASKNGELPMFGTGRMIPEFEKASFAIKNIGDISEPIQTSYGWHVIKLIEKKGIASYDDVKGDIKNKVSRDARAEMSKSAVVSRLKKEYKFTPNQKNLSAFYKVVTDSIFKGKWDTEQAKGLTKPLFAFANQTINQQEFAKYIGTHQAKKETSIESYVNKVFNDFVELTILNYEEAQLENKYPDFKFLMNEYHDGILLFDLTDKMVWTKAVQDSIGLSSFYEKNKANYMWEKRVDATIFQYNNDKSKEAAMKLFSQKEQKAYTDEALVKLANKKDTAALKLVEHKIYANGDNKDIDNLIFNTDNINKKAIAIPYTTDKRIVYINKTLAPEPKALLEAKGLVTADYQSFLESEWIKELRNKYKVTVNESVLKAIK